VDKKSLSIAKESQNTDSTATKKFFDRRINKDGKPEADFDLFFTPREVADMLGVSDKFVYERMARGELESQPIGRLKRIRKSTLETWLNSQKKGS
jgi:excisionase family DNA binding protein